MAYVILQPNSLTNPSGKYRVAESGEWTEHSEGRRSTYRVHGEADTYPGALEIRDRLNAGSDH